MNRSLASVALALSLAGVLRAEDAPAANLQLVCLEGSSLKIVDLGSGTSKTIANGVAFYRYDAGKKRLVFSDLEDLYVADLKGEKKSLVHMEKIVHPGCGHTESAIHEAAFCDGGVTVLFRYREVPAGVDPHVHADSQFHVAAVATDGTARVAIDKPPMLLSDGSNAGLGDLSPDGTRSIVSRSKRGRDKDSLDVELREHDGRGGGEGREIARFDLPILNYLQGEWSPDGKRYAFMIASITYRKHEIRVWDGKECRKVTEGACGLGLGGTGGMVLRWSPDGTRLAILPNDRAKGPAVQILDAVAGNVITTFVAGSDPGVPVFLPGTKKVVFLDYAACPLKGSHQHRFAACRPTLHLLDPDAKEGERSKELAAGQKLAYVPPIPTPDGRHLLVFTIASEKVPPGEWAEATERTYGMKAINLETGAVGEALKGVEFRALPAMVRTEAK